MEFESGEINTATPIIKLKLKLGLQDAGLFLGNGNWGMIWMGRERKGLKTKLEKTRCEENGNGHNGRKSSWKM